MKRSMFQVYVKDSAAAAELYKKAFDAKMLDEYKNPDGSYLHAELDVYGQVLALSEADAMAGERDPGTTMQLCLHMGAEKEEQVKKAYEALKDGAKIAYPIGECPYSPLMFALIDTFGVNWCVFV